jgi:peptidoglycan/xylan/chitin deacetylase (PgdA/CDA1 family)
MMWVTTPKLLRWVYPKRIWDFPECDRVHLTFDDGPIPEVTPWVLDLLKAQGVKATFFCIGDNIRKHPEIFSRILAEGHTVGNHTQNHLNGWKTPTKLYLENVMAAESQMLEAGLREQTERRKLFRPPYGRITHRQARALNAMGYDIIMWTVLSYDFDASISPLQCYQNVSQNLSPGTIVVFHDSLKAEKNLRYVLPKVLEQYYSIF